jgi:CRP/FNR family transcriptional regulator
MIQPDPLLDVDVLDLWQRVPYFQSLPRQIISELAAVATLHHYAAGEILFLECDPGAGLHLVVAGSVKVSRFSKEGREHILHIFNPGQTFNDVPVLDGGPNPATATALTKTDVWRIARPDLQALATRRPEVAWVLAESIARRARYLVDLVQDLSMRNVKGRLARLLLEQAGTNGNALARMLTQDEMASRLGTVREVVGRSLRSLTAAGIIEIDRHRIIILDPDRLADEAEI